MPPHEDARGVSGALRTHWRAVLSEVIATGLLLLLTLAACLPAVNSDGSPRAAPLVNPSFAIGFVAICLIEVFGPVSGAYMNPAVTLAAVLIGRSSIGLAAAYTLAQVTGAILGFAALQAFAPAEVDIGGTAFGVTLPARGVSAPAAAAIEGLLTGLLALLSCALWTAPAPYDHTMSIKFGLTVAGLVFAGGELTGASLNPVRSLAPALLQGVWTHHWVYWVGPLGGAALFSLLHRYVLAPRAHAHRTTE